MKTLDRKQLQQGTVLCVMFRSAIGYAVYQMFFAGSTGASTKSSATTASAQSAKEAEQQTTAPPWLSSSEPARDPFVIPPQFDNLKQSQAQTARPAPPRMASAPNISALPPMPVGAVSAGSGNASPSVNTQPVPAPQPESEPSISVTGVVVGEYPVAILRQENGSQRIAQPGSQLEGGYVLRTVLREGIVLEKAGKIGPSRPGGNPKAR